MQLPSQMLNMSMKNKKVLIVGGSRGIGEGVVNKFASFGANVYYFSRQKKKKVDGENNRNINHIKVDLHSEQSIQKGFQSYDTKENSLDILVNVAGINYTKRIEEIDMDEWDEVLDTNLRSFFYIIKKVLEIMPDGGKIVNVSSIAGRNRSVVSGVHYTASKAGIIGLTKQIAHEVGKRNINVNAVCPSQTRTDMLEESMTEKELKELGKLIPLGRIATRQEVVNGILFLCSEESSYITGTTLDINGGQL